MIQLDLTPMEAGILREILESNLRELLLEIAHSDHADYKEKLRRRAGVVETFLAKLPVATPVR